MPIDPDVARWLEHAMPRLAGPADATPVARRDSLEAAYRRFIADFPIAPGTGLASVVTRIERVPTDWGEVRLRVMVPPERGEPRPVVLHFFGGAWWQRTFDAADTVDMCRVLAAAAGVVVVQIDYALAPEHPYPAALEQGHAVLSFIASGGLPEADPARIAVAGISSGGNLAAALALLARDRGGPAIALQVLEVPVLDLTLEHYDESVYAAFPSIAGVDRPSSGPLREAVAWYARDADPAHPYLSPLRCPDLSRLPEALILTAEFDPLWVEGAAYARALAAAGTPATAVRYEGQIHSAPSLPAVAASARHWRAQVLQAVRAFAGS